MTLSEPDMHSTANAPAHSVSSAFARAAGFLAFWLILTGLSAADLPAGILAAAIASWTSLHLLPPGRQKLHPILLVRMLMRFLHQSIVAGFDTAWRALDPRLPLRPGVKIYRPASPAGTTRSAFCTMASLQPGLLPSGFNKDGDLIVHCLDVSWPVAQQLAGEEAQFLQALGREECHG
jgi:multicomponent Na+:H+ antiporter subunit E